MAADGTFFLRGVLVVAAIMSECQGQCEKGRRPLLIELDTDDPARHITSPNYPDDYPNNANCSWQFATGHHDYVVHLSVITLELDSDYVNCRSDYVDLYDIHYTLTVVTRNTPRLARLCSEKYGKEFYSSKPYLYVRFLSDAADTAPGFNLSVVAVPRSEAPTTTVTHPPIVSTTPTPTIKDSSDDLVAKVVGGTIGGLIAFIIIIVAIIFLCRRCLKPCLEDDVDPVPMTVPSAPPPEVAQGPPIYTSLVNDSDPQLFNYQLLPGTPRPDGGRADASRGTGHSGSPRPGSRLEVPEQNGRSTSPGSGSREGSPRRGPEGSPRQGDRGGSPWRDDRGRSPRRGSPDRSPRQGDRGGSPWRDDRGRSPRRGSPDRSPRQGDRGGSPWRDDHGRSPRRGSPDRSPRQGDRGGSPWRDDRGRSPRRGSPDRSPRQGDRGGSPWRDDRGGSPRQGDRGGSPWRDDRGRSPRRGSPDRSPRQGDRGGSPWRDDHGRSPRRGSPDRSPRPGGRRGSPRRDDRGRSPRRGSPEGSRHRRGSGPPPPIYILDSSGVTDAPPSYDEAIGTSPQPSAPPPPDENFV